jgi:hypothetical protein
MTKPIKLRVTVTAVVEYEANPEHYPGATTPQEMLAIDMEGADNDPYSFISTDSAEWKVTGEVVE